MGTVKEAADRHLAAFNAKDADAFVGNESPNIEFILPGAISLRGREQVKAYIQIFWRAFPDGTVTQQGQILAPEGAITESIFSGTHTGPLSTPDGEIPATGRRVRLRQAAVQRVTDGLISSEHLYFDQLELLGQLGILPGAKA
jgi:predicted ester cyclase